MTVILIMKKILLGLNFFFSLGFFANPLVLERCEHVVEYVVNDSPGTYSVRKLES
jgi:hypothetical protein